MRPGRSRKSRHASAKDDRPRSTVLIDSCVWHHSFSRNVLRHLALARAFSMHWSRSIESEWIRSVHRSHPGIPFDRLVAVRDRFRTEFPDGLVSESTPRQALPPLPDPDDEHVLRAAIVAGASEICTLDRRGFPAGILRPLGIRAITPAELLSDSVRLRPRESATALHTHRASLVRPAFSPQGYLDALRKSSLILDEEIARMVMQALLTAGAQS